MPDITTEFVRPFYVDSDSAHDFDHVLRVTKLADFIAQKEGANIRIVRTASLLHDISRKEQDHHITGAYKVRGILRGESTSFIEAVIHCIESHSFDRPPFPTTVEAKCLSDADKLDAIGATGIARTFAVAGMHDTRLWVAPIGKIRKEIGNEKRAYREQWGKTRGYTPTHEFLCKLEGLSSHMLTGTARKLGEERNRYMKEFFEKLDKENLGTISP